MLLLSVTVRVRFRTVNSLKNCLFMEVHRFNIVLVIETVVKLMVGFKSFTVMIFMMAAILVLLMMVNGFMATLVLMRVSVVVAVFVRTWVLKVHTMSISMTTVFIMRLVML